MVGGLLVDQATSETRASACHAAQANTETKSSYNADYYFYAPAK